MFVTVLSNIVSEISAVLLMHTSDVFSLCIIALALATSLWVVICRRK